MQRDVLTDEKFRISLPSELKDELIGNKRVITNSMDSHSLQIITLEEFNRIKEQINNKKATNIKQAQYYERLFVAPKEEIEFDKTLRIMIPQGMRSYAHLQGKSAITILSMDDRIEIWDKKTYEEYITGSMNDEMINTFDEFMTQGVKNV